MDDTYRLLPPSAQSFGASSMTTEASERTNPTTALGIPTDKKWLETTDAVGAFLSTLFLILAIISIKIDYVAYHLGQNQQLVVLGLLLSLMNLATSKQAVLFLVAAESRSSSILQHYDSILTSSAIARNIPMTLRAKVALILLLQPGVSTLYKQFVGGKTTLTLSPQDLAFGTVGPPGLYLGNGLSPMVNATLPLYKSLMSLTEDNPAQPGAYGFNMRVISDTKTALLDAPLNRTLSQMQAGLHEGQSMQISATVNATISELNSTPKSPERSDPDWSTSVSKNYNLFSSSLGPDIKFGLATNSPNYSLVYLAHWNDSKEDFWDNAVGIKTYRGWCTGEWLMTTNVVKLENAEDCHPGVDVNACNTDQGSITCYSIMLGEIYTSTLAEFITVGIPGNSPQISTWIAAVAAMVWARLTALSGPTTYSLSNPMNLTWEDYSKSNPLAQSLYSIRRASIKSTMPTLRPAWGLFLVLALQPFLMFGLLIMRLILYSSPVSSGFGITALLSGVVPESLKVLEGAGFSGRLKRAVRINIRIQREENPESILEDSATTRRRKVTYNLNSSTPNSRLSRSEVLG